jgi:hypothetical protein
MKFLEEKDFIDEEEAKETRKRCEQVDRKLNGLINSLRGRKKSQA